eukprot:363801-Chlamydomonas_euryale.AAC.4
MFDSDCAPNEPSRPSAARTSASRNERSAMPSVATAHAVLDSSCGPKRAICAPASRTSLPANSGSRTPVLATAHRMLQSSCGVHVGSCGATATASSLKNEAKAFANAAAPRASSFPRACCRAAAHARLPRDCGEASCSFETAAVSSAAMNAASSWPSRLSERPVTESDCGENSRRRGAAAAVNAQSSTGSVLLRPARSDHAARNASTAAASSPTPPLLPRVLRSLPPSLLLPPARWLLPKRYAIPSSASVIDQALASSSVAAARDTSVATSGDVTAQAVPLPERLPPPPPSLPPSPLLPPASNTSSSASTSWLPPDNAGSPPPPPPLPMPPPQSFPVASSALQASRLDMLGATAGTSDSSDCSVTASSAARPPTAVARLAACDSAADTWIELSVARCTSSAASSCGIELVPLMIAVT